MSQLLDFIKEQAAEAVSGKLSIPEELKEKVLGGVSDSIFESLKQTAGKEGGLEQITSLFNGQGSAESSPIATLAGKLFSGSIAEKLNLPPAISNVVTPLIPVVINKLTEAVSSGKGLDLGSILSAFGSNSSTGDLLKDAAGSLLGKLFK